MQDFLLARAQRRRAGDRTPLVQKLFGASNEAAGKLIGSRNKHNEILRILAPNQTLNGQKAGSPFDTVLLAGKRFGAELCGACEFVVKDVSLRVVTRTAFGTAVDFFKDTNFLHASFPPFALPAAANYRI